MYGLTQQITGCRFVYFGIKTSLHSIVSGGNTPSVCSLTTGSLRLCDIMFACLLLAAVHAVVCVPVVLLVILVICRQRSFRDKTGQRSVCVLVLGDFGRSPRMQYHTVSLSKQPRTSVDVVAYGESTPIAEVTSNKGIRLHFMRFAVIFLS